MKNTRSNPNSVIIWQGASRYTGAPLLVTGTYFSRNQKTGSMIQIQVIRADMSSTEAVRSGGNNANCGGCDAKKYCYVVTGHQPDAVYRSFKAGTIQDNFTPGIFTGRKVRLGSYGDLSAVPSKVWRDVLQGSIGHTGYTHDWRNRPSMAGFYMASTQNAAETAEANRKGFKAYEIRDEGEPCPKGYIDCPYPKTGRQCIDCMICDGTKGNVSIPVHGRSKSKFQSLTLEGLTV